MKTFMGLRLREGAPMRLAIIVDLFTFTLTLMLFALLPLFGDISTNPYDFREIFLFLLGFPVMIGMLGRMFVHPPIPGNQWAYLLLFFYTAFLGVTFFTSSLVRTSGEVEWTAQVLVASILISGLMGSAGAHVLDGGARTNASAMSRRFGGPPRE